MEAYDVLLNRRSIRKYTEQSVAPEILEKILKAGLAAPSAKNMQPWEFIVVTDREMLDKLSEVRPFWKMLKQAPLAIVTLADLRLYEGDKLGMYVQDCSAATENMLLAAEALGLGGVWLGLYPREEPIRDVRALLSILEESMPISVISIGYPAEQRPAHGEYLSMAKVHYEKY